MKDNHFKEIEENFHGDWLWSSVDGKETIRLSIHSKEVRLIRKKDGREIENIVFPEKCHWFDRFLCFSGQGSMYNITYADEKFLVFGKQASTSLGDYEWKKKFTRI